MEEFQIYFFLPYVLVLMDLLEQNFCSNMSIRSSTYGKKNIFEIPPCGSHFLVICFTYYSFEENHNFSNKNDHLLAWRKIGNVYFEGKTDV